MIEVEVDIDVFLPVYHHLLDDQFDIEILWGGRDSGKSRHIAQQLLIECMTLPYFRCVLVKKTFESIKDSQWQLLKDVANDWGVSHLFQFTESPLQVKCANGNKFIARGCDKPEKVKSIANPSHVWFEEADQLSQADYITVTTTLRSNHGKVRQFLSFNPETKGNRDDFWLYKTYFKDPLKRNFTDEYTIEDADGKTHTYRYRSTHSTYKNNPYCTPDRQNVLESLKVTDPYYYDVFTNGNWGQKEVKRPFITALRPEHVSECVYDPSKTLYISMDFNIDPFAFIFAHIDGGKVHVFDEATIKGGSVDKAIEYIKEMYGQGLHKMMLTGDPGGNKREITQRDNASIYMQISRGLRLRPNQLLTPSAPRHRNSREDVNYFLHHSPEVKIHPTKCKNLLFDFKTVEVDENGSIIKSNRKDDSQRADHLDAFRYLINTFMRPWILHHMKKPK